MYAMLHNIKIKLSLPEDLALVAVPDLDLAAAMDSEIGEFEAWFKSIGNGSLVGIERSILRTFLAWKLRYEAVIVDSED